MNFVEEVALYKKMHGSFARAEKAVEIAKEYLIYKRPISSSVEFSSILTAAKPASAKQRISAGSTHGSIFDADKELVILGPSKEGRLKPSKKHITELDLCRSLRTSLDKCSLSPEELLHLLAENIDSANTASPIGIQDGPVLRKALCRCGFPVADDDDDEQNATTTNQQESPTTELEEPNHDKDADENNQVEETDDSSNMGDLDVFDCIELVVMESLKQDYWKDFLASKEYQRLLHFWWNRDQTVVEEDFYLMRVLGRGGFGLVHACKKGTSGKLFAMKVMNKKRMKLKKSEQLALYELEALKAVTSPFIVTLSYSFHSKENLFLILDLMTGGNLGYHLQQRGQFSKRECLYFSARIMLGLQALHDCNIVYRDLKPENVLVADDGRVKLSDLGLAIFITPSLHGAAGTRGYWAPEMLRKDYTGRRKNYNHTADWFSFGCCLYEFISGYNPFRSQEALRFGMSEGMSTKEQALDCATLKMNPIYEPAIFDKNAADLCSRLLEKDENVRLGKNRCSEIMNHRYYQHMNWDAIISDRMKPPFIPSKDVNAASQSDIGTFATDKAWSDITIEPADEKIYKEWDWTSPKAFDAEVIEFLIHERRIGKPLLPKETPSSSCCSLL